MGLFRKKQHHRSRVDETMDSTYHEEDASTGKGRRSSGMGKWVCGSKSSKQVLEEDNKISSKNSYSSSTASSNDDKRDDKQGANANHSSRRASASPRDMDYDDLNNSLLSSIPPPAAQSAFDGPPRFDWIDVEYHAATRVQKVFRRHLVLQGMEQLGMSTSYIRNRKRERKAKSSFFPSDAAAPDFGFACCSMGLAYGDGDFDPADSIAYKEFHRKQYEEKTKAQKEREEFLSESYLAQKGIHSKVQELDQTKFRDDNLIGHYNI